MNLESFATKKNCSYEILPRCMCIDSLEYGGMSQMWTPFVYRLKELVLSFHACHMNQTSRQYTYASITHKEVSLTDNGVFKHVKVLSRQRGICIQGEMKVIGTCNTTIMCVCSLAPMFSACNIEKVGQR
jgi:hypothetical protein